MKQVECQDTKEICSTYKDYLESEHWHLKKLEFNKFRKKKKCDACGCKELIEVHHRFYFRLGCERLDDLMYLCRPCHQSIHDLQKKNISTSYNVLFEAHRAATNVILKPTKVRVSYLKKKKKKKKSTDPWIGFKNARM